MEVFKLGLELAQLLRHFKIFFLIQTCFLFEEIDIRFEFANEIILVLNSDFIFLKLFLQLLYLILIILCLLVLLFYLWKWFRLIVTLVNYWLNGWHIWRLACLIEGWKVKVKLQLIISLFNRLNLFYFFGSILNFRFCLINHLYCLKLFYLLFSLIFIIRYFLRYQFIILIFNRFNSLFYFVWWFILSFF